MKTVLTIAGSDSGGGAGIQADLKTFEFFGVFGCSAVTALTAQNTCAVTGIYPVDKDFVKKQIETVLDDFKPAAIKIGMLFDTAIIETVDKILQDKDIKIPVILDPVAVTNAGDKLLQDDAVEALKSLFKRVTLITPNKKELKLFLNLKHDIDANHIYTRCFEIRKKLGVDVVVKNFSEAGRSVDYLLQKEGLKKFESARIDSSNTHGTGCSFSSAIAANLALGKSLDDSLQRSKDYIEKAIAKAPDIGKCGGPIRHNLFRD